MKHLKELRYAGYIELLKPKEMSRGIIVRYGGSKPWFLSLNVESSKIHVSTFHEIDGCWEENVFCLLPRTKVGLKLALAFIKKESFAPETSIKSNCEDTLGVYYDETRIGDWSGLHEFGIYIT